MDGEYDGDERWVYGKLGRAYSDAIKHTSLELGILEEEEEVEEEDEEKDEEEDEEEEEVGDAAVVVLMMAWISSSMESICI